MDLGKIMIGIALIMLSAGLLISPSGAAGCDSSCLVGGGAFSPADATVTPYSPSEQASSAGYLAPEPGKADHGSAL
jgi:hypothetical protein